MKQLAVYNHEDLLFGVDPENEIALAGGGPEGFVFKTIQGEGALTGMPSVFLRLYGCNLACARCDTKHSWVNPGQNRRVLKVKHLLETLRMNLITMARPHLVVTGGEPLLQLEALLQLLDVVSCWDDVVNVTLETNGMLYDGCIRLLEYVTTLSLSPKLGHESMRGSKLPDYLMNILSDAAHVGIHTQMKLVVSTPEEVERGAAFLCGLIDAKWIIRENAILQPEWSSRLDIQDYAIQQCIHDGLRYMPQVHRLLSID